MGKHGDLEGLLVASVGHLPDDLNNPAMETRPMGSMEWKKAETKLKTQLKTQFKMQKDAVTDATTTFGHRTDSLAFYAGGKRRNVRATVSLRFL